MQLDIFDDSRDVQLRNTVADALLRGDVTAARAAAAALATDFPADPALAPIACLMQALEGRAARAFAGHDEAAAARVALAEIVAPASARVFGASAGPWLAARWSELAQRAAALPFDPRHADDHAAPLWLRAHRWDEAAGATERVESWRRKPAPLAWMTQARYHRHDLDGIWDLLAELAWLSCARLDAVLHAIDDPVLQKLRAGFEARFDGGAGIEHLCWFPAWLLVEKPSLAPLLAGAQRGFGTGPERALRVLVELLGLERQGRQRDAVERRKELRDLSAPLCAAYLATR